MCCLLPYQSRNPVWLKMLLLRFVCFLSQLSSWPHFSLCFCFFFLLNVSTVNLLSLYILYLIFHSSSPVYRLLLCKILISCMQTKICRYETSQMRNWICINEKGRRAFVSRNVEMEGNSRIRLEWECDGFIRYFSSLGVLSCVFWFSNLNISELKGTFIAKRHLTTLCFIIRPSKFFLYVQKSMLNRDFKKYLCSE